jgi:hypothetical protein
MHPIGPREQVEFHRPGQLTCDQPLGRIYPGFGPPPKAGIFPALNIQP